jgi:hypothetical protein
VVGESGELLGDISLADVERTMEGGDAHIATTEQPAPAEEISHS